MSADEERQTQAPASPRAEGEPPKGRNRRSGQRKGPRHEDPIEERRHRPKSGDRSGSNGFRDGIEHAFCAAMLVFPSPTGVKVHRPELATMTRPVVARREGAQLRCDLQHAGPHVWPDGEVVSHDNGAAEG
jgi:hypothetical protein